MAEYVTLKIFRYQPNVDTRPRFDTFQVRQRPGLMVLEALFDILEYQDASLAFRYSCRWGICGSCAMHINGRYRLACETRVEALGPEITVQPLQHFPIIKDLVVDFEGFFEKLAQVQPYLMPGDDDPAKERLQSPAQRERTEDGAKCILCACCQAACPMTLAHHAYLGPAVLLKLDRFHQDSRDDAKDLRLDLAEGEMGVWRCHTVFNCVEVCPKELHPAQAISHLKQGLARRKLFGWLRGRKR